MIFRLILTSLPSLIWLFYFLKKDKESEPRKQILKIFIFGIISALICFYFERILANYSKFFSFSILFILFTGFLEEIFKFLPVKFSALRSSALDESQDIIIYMIISALGFALFENSLIFFKKAIFLNNFQLIFVCFLRFLGATFLHAICSGIFGYFIVLYFYNSKNKFLYFFLGIFLSTMLHFLYNFFIISIEGSIVLLYEKISIFNVLEISVSGFLIILLLSFSSIFLSKSFKKTKHIKSICKI